jgi:hypothetical protein
MSEFDPLAAYNPFFRNPLEKTPRNFSETCTVYFINRIRSTFKPCKDVDEMKIDEKEAAKLDDLLVVRIVEGALDAIEKSRPDDATAVLHYKSSSVKFYARDNEEKQVWEFGVEFTCVWVTADEGVEQKMQQLNIKE